MAPRVVEVGFVQGRSDNLPKLDAFMLIEFAQTCEDYISAEIQNIKSDRSMRQSYTSSAVGKVRLKRTGNLCTVKAEVCPEHRQSSKNYRVSMVVDEKNDVVSDLQCEDCVASQGGCKHALVFLMWMNEKTTQPSPTDVESYWNKPKLSNTSNSAVLVTKDFKVVESKTAVDSLGSFLKVLSPRGQVDSMFSRYHTELDAVQRLDLRHLCTEYVESKSDGYNSSDFRDFCKLQMTDVALQAAFERTKEQSGSCLWHLLRHGRISGSTVHIAAQSKKPDGGVLKEVIFGVSTLHLTRAVQRRIELEP